MTRMIEAQPITAEAFAPFGQVIIHPDGFERIYYSDALRSDRPGASPSVSASQSAPFASDVLDAVQMERHEFSSQTFMPVDVSRYLAIVAPHGANGQPDTSAARAFVVPGTVGITYGANVWHHPMTVLDKPARFGIFMWLDGTNTDEEFVKLEPPFQVTWPTR